jgi:type I restriction enzyme S subunit
MEKLENLTSLISSGSTPKGGSETYLKTGPVMLIRSQNVRMNELDLSDVAYIMDDTHAAMSRSQVQDGDVLLNITGASIGRVATFQANGMRANVNQHVCIIRPKPNVLFHSYLMHLISSKDFQAEIARLQHGGTRQALTFSQIAEFSIPLPPLPEQRRIAEVLDRAEALRAKRRATLAHLDTLTQSIFLEMFGDPVNNPKKWADGTLLGDVADIVSGITKGRQVNGQEVRSIPYLAVVNVQDKALDLSILKTIDATEEEILRYHLRANDLLLTEGGDPDKLGRGTLWKGEVPECIHQNHIFRVRLTSTQLNPLFLNWLVGSERGKRYFLKSAKQTTGIASINMSQLRSFPLLIPPLTAQKEFARRIASVDGLKSAHRASLAKLDMLFKSLQHHAFQGELFC